MSAPNLRTIDALMEQAREVLHDDSLSLLVIGDGRVVVPYHIDAGGGRSVELRWSGAAWKIHRDGCELCWGMAIGGVDGEFREIQRILYEHEPRSGHGGTEEGRRVQQRSAH